MAHNALFDRPKGQGKQERLGAQSANMAHGQRAIPKIASEPW